jgi:hypothetical protein
MPLIKCPDCLNEVSDRAPSCPKCGAPISSENITTQSNLVTTQETSKTLKLQSLIAGVAIAMGTLLTLYGADAKPLGVILAAAGIVGYIVTRFRTWWHHK